MAAVCALEVDETIAGVLDVARHSRTNAGSADAFRYAEINEGIDTPEPQRHALPPT